MIDRKSLQAGEATVTWTPGLGHPPRDHVLFSPSAPPHRRRPAQTGRRDGRQALRDAEHAARLLRRPGEVPAHRARRGRSRGEVVRCR